MIYNTLPARSSPLTPERSGGYAIQPLNPSESWHSAQSMVTQDPLNLIGIQDQNGAHHARFSMATNGAVNFVCSGFLGNKYPFCLGSRLQFQLVNCPFDLNPCCFYFLREKGVDRKRESSIVNISCEGGDSGYSILPKRSLFPRFSTPHKGSSIFPIVCNHPEDFEQVQRTVRI